MSEAKIREDIENTVNTYSKIIYRTCLLMLGNAHDADDVLNLFYVVVDGVLLQDKRLLDADQVESVLTDGVHFGRHKRVTFLSTK